MNRVTHCFAWPAAASIVLAAAWTSSRQGDGEAAHWAYVAPGRVEVPAVRDASWVKVPIDAFVLAKLEAEGLAPSDEADRATLLRRLSLDLTGLPPTLDELDAFETDTAPDAYERAVRRLVDSPHYGEQRAREWLDLARYADTHGYEKDERRTMWPWRDWVIEAFNRDLSFDRFTIEQLAGDLLPDATREQRVATGFHRNTMLNMEGGADPEEFRADAVVDRVNTTASVWLGTTLACAQCHDHKYDPFSQKEYFQLYAFFNDTRDTGNLEDPLVSLPTPEQARRLQELEGEIALLKAEAEADPEQLERLEGERKTLDGDIPRTMVLAAVEEPRATFVHRRGSFLAPGESVQPEVPSVLPPLPDGVARNRLAFARWLVDGRNPLTARVAVNRAWQQLFGRGLVATPGDFGTRGDAPTHPELLDWLASELVRLGWSQKELYALIVSSATYRQSSRVTPELYERDPDNRWLARAPRYRVAAESVRDVALAASGLLDRSLGGPSVFPYQPPGLWSATYNNDRWATDSGPDRYRRGLYTFWRRTVHYASFALFDAPSREISCARRERSNTPLQALATLNDPAFVEAAGALARRMLREGGSTTAEKALVGFRLCTSRRPSEAELAVLSELYEGELAYFGANEEAARSLLEVLPEASESEAPDPAELAAWTAVANALLNLDETLSRN